MKMLFVAVLYLLSVTTTSSEPHHSVDNELCKHINPEKCIIETIGRLCPQMCSAHGLAATDPESMERGYVEQSCIPKDKCLKEKGKCISSTFKCNGKTIPKGCRGKKCHCCVTKSKKNLLVTITTGYAKDAGTFSGVIMDFVDNKGNKIRFYLRSVPKQSETQYHRISIPKRFGRLVTLKLGLDNKNGSSSDWYCEHIFVDDPRIKNRLYFPIDRWIQSNLWYEFQNYATSLPQFEPYKQTRKQTMRNKRKNYEFTYHLISAMSKHYPDEEHYIPEYETKLHAKRISSHTNQEPLLRSFLSSKNMSTFWGGDFYVPESMHLWKDDAWFGAERVQGALPSIIEICHKIPQNLGVTEASVAGLLEGLTLQQALANNKIFITDLGVLDGIEFGSKIDHASPFAVFYLNKINQLMPIAIQLKKRKGPNNPIYTPKDPPNTWLIAKIYYNHAECQYQVGIAHFGYTHALMDGFSTSMNRQLSPSHPIFKILKPHFLHDIAMSKLGEDRLVFPGSLFDKFSFGSPGLKAMLAKIFPTFSFKRAIGSVESDAKARGVWDKKILPYYPFRDDAYSMYSIIRKYVTTIMTHYYDTPGKIANDWELQSWRAELVRPRAQNGVGVLDLPGSDTTGIHGIEEIIDLLTMIISQTTFGHAAVNFPQYDAMGYFPNYPGVLKEVPPQQKRTYTDDEIMSLFTDLKVWCSIRGAALFLSWKGTNGIGDFERVYLYDPVSRKAQVELRKDLNKFSKEVKNRNKKRFIPYKYLDPKFVPNSISI